MHDLTGASREPAAAPAARLYTPRLLLILSLQFAFGLGFSSFFLLPKYLTEAHQADAATIGRIMAAAPVSAVLVMPILARYVDRVRRHWLLVGGAAALLVACVGFTQIEQLSAQVYVYRALQGAAFTIYMSTCSALVVELAPLARLGQALGLLGAANLATNAIGPGAAEPLAAARGWTTVFIASSVCACLATIGSLALRQPHPARARSRLPLRLAAPRQRGLLYACMVTGFSFGCIVTFYQPLALSIGISEVRDLFIGYTLTALGVRLLFGSWLDRFERRRVAMIASAGYALVVLATAGLGHIGLLPLGLALGLSHGALYPVMSALFIEGSQDGVRGALMTYFGGAFNLGMVLSTLGLGAVAAHVGLRGVFVLSGLLAFTGVLAIQRATRPGAAQH